MPAPPSPTSMAGWRVALVLAILAAGCAGSGSEDPDHVLPGREAKFLRVLSWTHTYDHAGFLRVYAEAENPHDRPMLLVTADLWAYDAEGNVLHHATEVSPRSRLPPGERAPVVFTLQDPDRRAARFDVSFSGPLGNASDLPTGLPTAQIVSSGRVADAGGVWAEARVHNPHDDAARAKVVVTFHDASDRIIGLEYGAPSPHPVPARGESVYRAEAYDLAGTFASARVAVAPP